VLVWVADVVTIVYLLDMRDFVGWLVAEQEVDGMFTGNVRSSDPDWKSDRLTRLNRSTIT